LRLVGEREVAWAGRAHFYAAAAEAIRRILTDHARKRQRLKRGGAARRVPLSVVDLAEEHDPDTILILDEAIWRLDKSDAVLAQVVRLRFYAGLSVAETAHAMNVSEPTIKRHWRAARAWLYGALQENRD
jgi:RNA polymerase sigma factor (TIGR02999 family)